MPSKLPQAISAPFPCSESPPKGHLVCECRPYCLRRYGDRQTPVPNTLPSLVLRVPPVRCIILLQAFFLNDVDSVSVFPEQKCEPLEDSSHYVADAAEAHKAAST